MKKETISLLIPIIMFLFIHLYRISLNPWIGWDESVYLGMGKYIATTGDSGLWEGLRPPLLPLFLSLLWIITPDNLFVSGHILVLIFSVTCLYMTYILGNHFFDRKTAILSVLILCVTPVFFILSTSILTGIGSTSLALIGIYFYTKKRYMFSGFFLTLSSLMRFPQILTATAILLLICRKRSELRRFLFGCFPFLIYLLLNTAVYGNPFQPMFDAINDMYSEYVWLYEHDLFFYLYSIPLQNMFFIFSLPWFPLKFRERNKIKFCPLILPLLFLFIFFTLLAHKEIRFSIVMLPYLSLISADGFFELVSRLRLKQLSFIALLLLIYPVFLIADNLAPYYMEENFLSNCNIGNGTVLSSIPYPVKYIDNKLIGFYSVNKMDEVYEKFKGRVTYIIFTNASFPCNTEECKIKVSNFFEKMKSENRLICKGKILDNQMFYVFRTKK